MPTQVFEMTDKSACKYWDCGWCYAPNYLKTNAINSTCVNPYECPISPLSEPVQYETTMTEIEELKAQIKVLEAKLSLLEEIEKHKSPCEEAYKDWWGQYPELETDWEVDVTRWQGFQAGYHFAYEEKVVEEPEDTVWKSVALRFGEKLSDVGPDGYYELSPDAWFRWAVFTYGKNQQVKELVRESVKWCEEHPDKDPLDWLKPQTPEQVADGLKEAFREAVKQGVVSSSNKPQTLTDLIAEWWEYLEDTLDMDSSIKDLVNDIEEWLPKEQSASGSQNAYVECSVEGYNDCINKIRRKLK
jgi:hypothetical protein